MPIADTTEGRAAAQGGGGTAAVGAGDGVLYGTHASPTFADGLEVSRVELGGAGRPFARPAAGCPEGDAAPGLLVVLDGTRILRRVARMVEDGRLDPSRLPAMVGIDPDPADRGLAQYTPWWHPAYRQGAPDFGGRAAEFLEQEVLPVTRAARDMPGAGDGPVGILGYSLAGLFCLDAAMHTDAFGTFLVASPSTWYPGFVDRVARTRLACDPRFVLAYGTDEGADHPEPIAGIRQETDRLVAALTERTTRRPEVVTDTLDHHRGLDVRLEALLARWG